MEITRSSILFISWFSLSARTGNASETSQRWKRSTCDEEPDSRRRTRQSECRRFFYVGVTVETRFSTLWCLHRRSRRKWEGSRWRESRSRPRIPSCFAKSRGCWTTNERKTKTSKGLWVLVQIFLNRGPYKPEAAFFGFRAAIGEINDKILPRANQYLWWGVWILGPCGSVARLCL